MGNTTSSTINDSIISITNEEIKKITIKQLQDHSARVGTVQRIFAITENGNVVIRNTNLQSIVNISLESYQKMMNVDQLSSAVDTSIDKYYENSVKASTVSLSPTITEIVNKYKADVKNLLTTKITSEQINKCMASAYLVQEIKAETKNGDITIENIDMNIVSSVSANCLSEIVKETLSSSSLTTELIDKLKNTSETQSPEIKIPDLGSLSSISIIAIVSAILSSISCTLLFLLLIFTLFRNNNTTVSYKI